MTSEPLATRLRALSTELSGLPSLDPDTRRVAATLSAELERLGAAADLSRSSASALEALAVRFEADHPALSAALRQGADLLGKAGI